MSEGGSDAVATPFRGKATKALGEGWKRVGPYVLGRTIGEGEFGTVFHGVHDATGLKVAIKAINKHTAALGSGASEPSHNIAIQREIAISKRLIHPNICRLFDVVETQNRIYLVMELVEGGYTLRDLILDEYWGKGMDELTACKLFRQMLSAVEYCHSHNVAHRDLKAENILIDKATQRVRITDFGFAGAFQWGGALQTKCGTPTHAAPELFGDDPYHPPAVDIWALGVLLFNMNSDAYPFPGSSINEVRTKILQGNYDTPSQFSPELSHLIGRMLERDVCQRISTRQLLAHPWVGIAVAGQPVTVHVNKRSMKFTASPNCIYIPQMLDLGFTYAEIMDAHENQTFGPASAILSLLEEEMFSPAIDIMETTESTKSTSHGETLTRNDSVSLRGSGRPRSNSVPGRPSAQIVAQQQAAVDAPKTSGSSSDHSHAVNADRVPSMQRKKHVFLMAPGEPQNRIKRIGSAPFHPPPLAASKRTSTTTSLVSQMKRVISRTIFRGSRRGRVEASVGGDEVDEVDVVGRLSAEPEERETPPDDMFAKMRDRFDVL